MKKIAEIVSIKGNIATIMVERSTMCDGCTVKAQNGKCSCSHSSLFGESKSFVSEAVCDIPVNVGDKVIIETSDSNVLRTALLVFILPIVLFIAAYAVTFNLVNREGVSFIAAVIAFFIAFTIIGFVEKKKKDKLPDITVLQVISTQNSK